MDIEELEEDIEEKTVQSASVTSLQEEVQGEANEIEDNVETAVDETLTNNSSYEELPIVEEELVPVVLTKEEEDDKVVASEVVEEEDLPTETVDDVAVMGDHNSTTIGSLDDPFLLVGKKLSSSNTSLSTMRQDSLQYSLSSKGTTAANTSTLQNHNNEDDDSLFNDVDHDMSRFGGSPEKKNLDEEKPMKVENDDQKPPLSSITTIKSLSQNLVKETFEAAGKVSPRSPKSSRNDSEVKQKEEGNEEMKSDVPQKNDAISKTETKSKMKKSEKEKGKVSKEEIEKEKEKPKEEKEKEKEKLPFRAKKGLPKSNVIQAPDPKDPPASDLTPQEMADQAEKQALQQKKEREEKLQLKKFKRNIEKLQQPEDQNKENEQESAHRKKSIRNKEDHKDKNEAVVEDKPKRPNRRLSKEKPETKDNEHLKPQENITDAEAQKQPRSYLKRKVPSTLKKDENHTDNDHHLPDVVPSSRRQIEKEESKDPDNPITDSLNPPKRKVHPSKFPAIIRNKVHQKEKFELETSADDSSINTEKRQRIRVPFSSPSERGHHSENNSESKHKKRKPLYLRLEEKARRLRMEEEKIKHEAYVQLRNKRYKQPTREEIKEHMKHFDELLKLKSEEFKQNHVSQMRQLRQQKVHQKTGDGEGVDDDNNSILTNNNPWDSDSLLTPKKPQHTKKDSSKAHQQHRSVRKKSKENQNEDFDGHNGDDEADKELVHNEMMLNNMSSIQDFLITTEDQALDTKKIDAELKSPNELKAASDFIPVTAPNTVKKAEEFISPSIDSPGKNLPNEEIASLLESDWIGRMKE